LTVAGWDFDAARAASAASGIKLDTLYRRVRRRGLGVAEAAALGTPVPRDRRRREALRMCRRAKWLEVVNRARMAGVSPFSVEALMRHRGIELDAAVECAALTRGRR